MEFRWWGRREAGIFGRRPARSATSTNSEPWKTAILAWPSNQMAPRSSKPILLTSLPRQPVGQTRWQTYSCLHAYCMQCSSLTHCSFFFFSIPHFCMGFHSPSFRTQLTSCLRQETINSLHPPHSHSRLNTLLGFHVSCAFLYLVPIPWIVT